MKTCCRCKNSKPLSEFNKNRTKKDGHQPYCRVCHNAADRKWYVDNDKRRLSEKINRLKSVRKWFTNYRSKLKCSRCPEVPRAGVLKGGVAEHFSLLYSFQRGDLCVAGRREVRVLPRALIFDN